ncbi:MAG: hypothetical protein ACK58T_46885 [Phycisphaerae bacterium]
MGWLVRVDAADGGLVLFGGGGGRDRGVAVEGSLVRSDFVPWAGLQRLGSRAASGGAVLGGADWDF